MKRYIPALLLTVAMLSLVATGVLVFAGLTTNSTITVREMARRQMGDPKAIALPFDLKFWADYKLAMLPLQRPDVVLVGPSRGGQLRSEMFRPYSFYNLSLTAWNLDQTIEMLQAMFRAHKPRVVMVSMDYFMFSEPYVRSVKGQRDMWFDAPVRYQLGVVPQILKEWRLNPAFFVRAFSEERSLYVAQQRRLLGFAGVRGGVGFRKDGSFLYGQSMFDQSVEKLKANEGILQAIPGAPRVGSSQLNKLAELAALAKQNGVTLVGIQLPMWQDTVRVLDTNDRSVGGVWAEFQSSQMHDRFDELGIAFFDLSRDPVISEYRNFVDAAHPSERGMLVSLLSLSKNEKFASIFPELDARGLGDDLARADEQNQPFSIYGDAH